MSDTERVSVDHRRLGPIEVPTAEILAFEGMPGFPEVRRFTLLRHDRESAFLWLASLDCPDLAFVVASPYQFFPDYDPRPSSAQLAAVGAERAEQLEIYTIATLREGSITLNLAAPLLLHPQAQRGAQVILEGPEYSTREPLPEIAKPEPPAALAVEREPETQSAQMESKPQR